MKELIYKVFALIFNLNRIFPVKKNRVIMLSPHPASENDSLSLLSRCFYDKGGFEVIRVNVPRSKNLLIMLRFMLITPAQMARASYIYLNDNFMPLTYMKVSDKAVVTQLWHGEGAFKKFCLDSERDEKTRKRLKRCADKYSYVICTGKNCVPIYAGAFGVDENKVLPLGSPRNDTLISQKDDPKVREEFDSRFPDCKGKKLVLYAPTFRENTADDTSLLDNLNPGELCEKLGEEYALLIKLHPRIHTCRVPDSAIDVTNVDISLLTLVCDVLVTDYSSVCMDFALLSKKCVFYAYDLEKYDSQRSFYFDYESCVPGEIVKDSIGLASAIKNPPNAEKIKRFREFNFDYTDDKNTRRVFEKTTSSTL